LNDYLLCRLVCFAVSPAASGSLPHTALVDNSFSGMRG
jgi:hypothetical protein